MQIQKSNAGSWNKGCKPKQKRAPDSLRYGLRQPTWYIRWKAAENTVQDQSNDADLHEYEANEQYVR